MNVEAFVDDPAVRSEGVSLSRGHAACTQGVPGCFDVALDCWDVLVLCDSGMG